MRTLNRNKLNSHWLRSNHDIGILHGLDEYTIIRVDKAQGSPELEGYLSVVIQKGHCTINDLITAPVKLRYNRATDEETSFPMVELFMRDIEKVCLHHNLSISHEDEHGGFIIQKFTGECFRWLNSASVDIAPPKPPMQLTHTGALPE